MLNKCLAIGCNNYDYLSSLRFCEDDALQFCHTIEEILGTDETKTSLSVSPTKNEFQQDLLVYFDTLEAGDRATLFFAGHGYSIDGEDRLALKDSKLSEPDSFLSVSWLIDELQKRKVHATIYLDACRERATSRKTSGSPNAFGRTAQTKAATAGIVLFFGCSPGELSYECEIEEGLGQGVFTHLMCIALKGLADRNPLEIDKRITELAVDFYLKFDIAQQRPFSSAQPVNLANVDVFTGEISASSTHPNGRLLVIAGPSNAGKTSLAQHLSSRWKWRHSEMSSFAYDRYNKFNDGEPSADLSIQEFMEEEVWNSGDYAVIAQDFLETLSNGEDVLLSGVRRPEEIEEIRGKISNVDIVFLFANARVRFDRHLDNVPEYLKTRMGTTYKEFVKRDMKEFGWGMGKVEAMDRSTLILNEGEMPRMFRDADNKFKS